MDGHILPNTGDHGDIVSGGGFEQLADLACIITKVRSIRKYNENSSPKQGVRGAVTFRVSAEWLCLLFGKAEQRCPVGDHTMYGLKYHVVYTI